MSVHLTAAEARKLGVDTKTSGKVRVRHTASGPYCTVCKSCGQTFTTLAAEDRHVTSGHNRFELVLGWTP